MNFQFLLEYADEMQERRLYIRSNSHEIADIGGMCDGVKVAGSQTTSDAGNVMN